MKGRVSMDYVMFELSNGVVTGFPLNGTWTRRGYLRRMRHLCKKERAHIIDERIETLPLMGD